MHFKWNPSDFQNPLNQSLLLHIGVLFAFFMLMVLNRTDLTTDRKIEFEVFLPPVPAQPLSLTAPKPVPPPATQKPRAVFGASRRALRSDASPVEVKTGNTIAKKEDTDTLNPDDADSLPIPTDEFLVTEMPVLKNEIRVPYPPESRRKGIEGPVVMDVLIDANGKVRKVELVKGPAKDLNEAAVAAVRQFQFSGARVGDQKVPVKIRYVYRFVLDR